MADLVEYEQTGIDGELQKNLESVYEQMLLQPCRSKEELNQWIKTFLGISLPDATLDEEISNSNPLNFIWEVYEAALTGNTEKTSFVVAASRNSTKTLGVSILEFMLMLHFGRDIIHMAAILDQSDAAVNYINNFLRIPAVRRFASTDNRRMKVLKDLPKTQDRPTTSCKMRVIVASKESANAQRASVLCFDELDLIEEKVLSESAMIGDPDRNGKPPIFIYLSSRKSASGPIQKKIDQSADPKNGISLHKWNLTDMMRKCPESVHRPELPRLPLYIEREVLDVKTQEQIDALPPEKREGYDRYEAYAGCVECPAFLACKAKSPGQYSQESSILRDIPFVRTVLRETGDPEQIKAQVLNLKPESSGVIYNRFSRNLHYKPLNEVYKFAFGVYPDKGKWVTRGAFVAELKQNGWRITCGVDFGYTDPATAVVIAYSRSQDKVIIVDCDTATGYANPDWLAHIKNTLYPKYEFDLLCPDTADKSSPGVASKLGMPSRNKKPLRVETGVSWIRDHLWNVSRQETRFMIIEDKNNEGFVQSMEQWQYKKTIMGFQYGHFEDDTWPTHFQDAHRYGIDPYVMVGAASYSISSDVPIIGTIKDEEEAKKVLSTVEDTLSRPESFYKAMSDEYYEQSRIRVDFSKERVKTKNTNETGNFLFSFE